MLIQLLNFTFTDDVYARILLWEGHDVCEAIIGPSEERLFAVLSEKLPQSEKMSVEMQFDIIRALLVNAVVMNRACKSEDDTRAQFRDLLNVTLGAYSPTCSLTNKSNPVTGELCLFGLHRHHE